MFTSSVFKGILGDVECTPLFPKNSFDLILCKDVLHHFPDLSISPTIENLNYWLKLGGHVIIFEPNGTNPMIWIPNRIILKVAFQVMKNVNFNVTKNESVMGYYTYRKIFLDHGFDEIYKRAWTTKQKNCDSNMPNFYNCFINFRRFLTRNLWFPYGGENQILIYKKIKNSTQ